jgi:hypothetical protein
MTGEILNKLNDRGFKCLIRKPPRQKTFRTWLSLVASPGIGGQPKMALYVRDWRPVPDGEIELSKPEP